MILIGRSIGWTLVLTCMVSFARAVGAATVACEVCDCSSGWPHIVDCSKRGLRELPEAIPNDTEVLDLQGNLLQEIPYYGFMTLTNLVRLTIDDNEIRKTFEIPGSVFVFTAARNRLEDLKPLMKNGASLQTVNLENNNFKKVEADTFKRCAQLSNIHLENNAISTIEERGFAGPLNIMQLVMNGNKLTELSPTNTAGLKCKVLSMDYNKLKVIQPFTFGGIPTLGRIELQNNQLEEVPYGLFLDSKVGLQHRDRLISDLRLYNNNIRRISPGAFFGVHSFIVLTLFRNKLISLPEDLFANLTINGTLDLSFNQLRTIPDGLLQGQSILKNLHLEGNQIRSLNNRMFRGLHNLKEFMIFGNPLVELEDWLFFYTRLTNLYMFQTNLSSIGLRPFATVNKTIKQVSLYGNKLERIENSVWQDLAPECYVSIDNILKFAPSINRTDITIELVGDGFAQPIDVPRDIAELFLRSGFICHSSSKTIHDKLWQCTPCPQGFYGTPKSDGCKACPSGGFYQIKTGQVADQSGMNCQTCNDGTYVTPEDHPGTSPADCVVCPTGTNKSLHAGFRACKCLNNYYRKDRFGECFPCPTEGVNCSAEYQHLLPGYWWTWNWGTNNSYEDYKRFVRNLRTENASYDGTVTFLGSLPKVYPCSRRESCRDESDGIDASCKEGYEGWLCSVCSTGYYSWFDYCFECPDWWWFMLEVAGVLVAVMVVVTVIAWNLHRSRRQGRSVADVLLARGKIVLGFYQVMGEIFSSIDDVPWPEALTKVGSFFKLLEVNIMQLIISPKCYIPDFTFPNIYIEFLVGLSFVVFVLLVALCYYQLRKCCLELREADPQVEEHAASLSQTRERCYLVVVMLLFISYPSLSSVILTLLPSGCDLFYLDEHETLNVSRLRSDYSVNCKTQQHVHFSFAAEAALCYVVGLPLVLFVMLWWRNRKERSGVTYPTESDSQSSARPLLNVSGEDGMVDGGSGSQMPPVDEDVSGFADNEPLIGNPERDQISWESFLCENYKPQFWYWEIVELTRKILQMLLVLLAGPEDPFTLFATIVISVGFLLIHAYVKPMKDAAEHRLQMCSLGTIFLNLLAASLLLTPAKEDRPSQSRKEILAVVIVLFNLSIILFVAASLIWTGLKTLYRRASRCNQTGCRRLWGRCCRSPRHERSTRDASINVNPEEDPVLSLHPSCPDEISENVAM